MITIDWGNKIINVPKADTTLIQASPFEIRSLDVNVLRLALKDLEDDEEGMAFERTHRHSTETVLSNVTYARFVEIINGYTLQFEDGQYGVVLSGANNNLLDVKVGNQVSLLGNNSAGLIRAGGTITTAEVDTVASRTRDYILSTEIQNSGSPGTIRTHTPV